MRLNMHNVSFASIKRPVSFTGRFIVLVLRLAQMIVLPRNLTYRTRQAYCQMRCLCWLQPTTMSNTL